MSAERMMGPINEEVLHERELGKPIEMQVKIELGNDKPEYVVQRILRGYPKDSGDEIDYHDYFSVTYLDGKDWKQHMQPTYFINYFLPEDINDFFFFDGEKLDEFFKAESNKNVKKAILDVSQINLTNNAIEHLEKVKYQIQKSSKGLSSLADSIFKDIQKAKDVLEEKQLDFKKKKELLAETDKNLEEIKETLRTSDIETVKKLEADREKLDEEMQRVQNELGYTKDRSVNDLIDVAPLIFAHESISATLEAVEKKYKSGELPPKIRETFLNELLKRGTCICGTDIAKDGSHRKSVQRLLEVARFSKIDDEVTKGKFDIKAMMKRIEGFVSTREKFGKEIREKEDELRKKLELKKEISVRLEKIDVEDIKFKESRRKDFERSHDSLTGDIAVLEIEIKRLVSHITSLETDYNKELRKSEKHLYLLSQIEICDKALNTLTTIKEALVNEVRQTIEAKTKQYFLSLIWKKDTYVDVKIDENYRVSVIYKGGFDALGSLSAGERQVLALSFMAALNEVSGFTAPVIIDTPLGRISGEPRDNIARLLPEYLKGTQVTLLVTDQEYTPSVRKGLLTRIGKEYQLVFEEKKGETMVMPLDDR